MTTYVVTSDNCTVGTRGTTVTGEQLGGCNVSALVSAGHLSVSPPEPTSAATPAADKKEQ